MATVPSPNHGIAETKGPLDTWTFSGAPFGSTPLQNLHPHPLRYEMFSPLALLPMIESGLQDAFGVCCVFLSGLPPLDRSCTRASSSSLATSSASTYSATLLPLVARAGL